MHASIAHTLVHVASPGATSTTGAFAVLAIMLAGCLRLQCVDHGVGGDVVVRTRRKIAHTLVHVTSPRATSTTGAFAVLAIMLAGRLRLQCVDHGVGGDVVVRTPC